MTITIKPGQLCLSELQTIFASRCQVQLHADAYSAIQAAADEVTRVISTGSTVYGINTGFGLLAQTKISDDDLYALQRNIVLSHAAGVGELLDDKTVGLMMVLKVAALACGHSGVRVCVVEFLLALYNAGIYPCVPGQGSVGASGDLAPLAHMAMTVIGEGDVHYQGQRVPAMQALSQVKCVALLRMRFGRRDPSAPFALARDSISPALRVLRTLRTGSRMTLRRHKDFLALAGALQKIAGYRGCLR